MHTHRVGAVRQKCLTSAALVGGIADLDPEQDLARLKRILEMSRVPWDEPTSERLL